MSKFPALSLRGGISSANASNAKILRRHDADVTYIHYVGCCVIRNVSSRGDEYRISKYQLEEELVCDIPFGFKSCIGHYMKLHYRMLSSGIKHGCLHNAHLVTLVVHCVAMHKWTNAGIWLCHKKNVFCVAGPLWGGFSSQFTMPVMQLIDIFVNVRLNKRLKL